MSPTETHGGCFCGAVRYRVLGEPRVTCLCHCADCRKICGTQSVAWVTYPVDRFAFTQGEPVRFHSSPPVTRTFCGQCGTPLTYQVEERAGEIDITTGSMDDPEAFPPQKEVFVEQKLSWIGYGK
jgi:hypothetical protein